MHIRISCPPTISPCFYGVDTPRRSELIAATHSLAEIRRIHGRLESLLRFPEEFLARYKGLLFQIRSDGVTVSDRRAVKLLKLFAANALFDGRSSVNDGDFFVLKHIWNNEDQAAILESIVTPTLESHYRDHPNARRVGAEAGGPCGMGAHGAFPTTAGRASGPATPASAPDVTSAAATAISGAR